MRSECCLFDPRTLAERLLAKQSKRILKRMHRRKPKSRCRGINIAKLVSQRRNALSMTDRLSGCSSVRNSLTGQRKRHVESGWCDPADDVGADSQPIRRQ